MLTAFSHTILYLLLFPFFANKQDLPGAKDVNKLIQVYEFDKIKDHIWNIQSCSALKGEGLITGIKWLSEQLVFRGKNNFPNNPYIINENDVTNENQEKKENHTESEEINNNKNIIDNNNSENNIKNINESDNFENKKEENDINDINDINISSNKNEN